jgi:hypothetical protein
MSQWLTGDIFGWSGMWGTTDATNLRLALAKLSEEKWIDKAKKPRSPPPMPWFNLNAMRRGPPGDLPVPGSSA